MKAYVVGAFLLAAGAPAAAQQGPMGPSRPAMTLDADAAQALDRMGTHLRSLQSFQVRSEATVERVYEGGHKLQGRLDTTYTVQMPDRMLVDIKTDTTHRRVYYNGAIMTVSAVKASRYTSFPVTGSVAEVLRNAYDSFGLEFPLQDLFRWGSGSADTVTPNAGFRVGPSEVGGRAAGHYAFRQPGTDFQIWIAEGPEPLPLRMVITNTENPAQPQYAATFHWSVAPPMAVSDFTFQPGPSDRAIDFGAIKASAK